MILCENCQKEYPDDEPEMMDVDGQTFCCWGCILEFGNQGGIADDYMTHEGSVKASAAHYEMIAKILAKGDKT